MNKKHVFCLKVLSLRVSVLVKVYLVIHNNLIITVNKNFYFLQVLGLDGSELAKSKDPKYPQNRSLLTI